MILRNIFLGFLVLQVVVMWYLFGFLLVPFSMFTPTVTLYIHTVIGLAVVWVFWDKRGTLKDRPRGIGYAFSRRTYKRAVDRLDKELRWTFGMIDEAPEHWEKDLWFKRVSELYALRQKIQRRMWREEGRL